MAFSLRPDPILSTLNELLNMHDTLDSSKGMNSAARSYVRDTKAQANTAVDVKELPNAYVFIADMPGLKSADIKVQIENDNVLTIGGERKREEPTADTKYLQLERSSASCNDGILTVTVPKMPPPEPHKPKTIEVTGS